MTTISDDPWISKSSQIAPENLHALGVINYRWNIADFSLKAILAQLSSVNFGLMWAIIHEMGDLAIVSAITEILSLSNIPEPVKGSVVQGLKLYDRNRINVTS